MNSELLEKIQIAYEAGNKKLTAVLKDGTKQDLRLFKSTQGYLCYYKKGSSTRGYPLYSENYIVGIMPINESKKELTVKDKYLDNIRKFKKVFTEKVHPNLWKNLQDGYKSFDIDEFSNLISGDDTYEFYKKLCEYRNSKQIITENHYKTTTIASNKPRKYTSEWQYNECVANVKKHLDNKEEFNYSWESNYDVSVSGRLCDDGIYRAWFSLEFRGCGNGHYYLLVNENLAVFSEDD